MSLIKHKGNTPETAQDWPFALLPFRWFDELFRVPAGEQVIRVEEFTKDNTLVVRAELPGIDPEKDVEVTVEGELLNITAQRKEEEQTGDSLFRRSELRYGSFARTIVLPEGVDGDAVTASYRNGILEVRVPLPPEASKEPSRRVPVQQA